MATELEKGGQRLWHHDEAHAYGSFHTYDAFWVEGMAAPRKLHLLLPREALAPGRRWPVIYFNDGNTTFWPGGLAHQSWNVAQTLSLPELLKSVEPSLVVAVHPVDRNRDLTDVPWAPGQSCCGLRDYARELALLLKPFIDAHYPTLPEPRHNTIVGSSHGGTAAFFIATRYPAQFGRALLMSPAFWVATGYDYAEHGSALLDSELLQEVAQVLAEPKLRPQFWLDWGMVHEGGFHNEVIERLGMLRGRELAALLVEHFGYRLDEDLLVHEDLLGAHDEQSWGRRFRELCPRFFARGGRDSSESR